MSTMTATLQKSFQWMQDMGVDPADVSWLESNTGSIALHSPEAALRVEKMYHKALTGIVLSETPVQSLAKTLLS